MYEATIEREETQVDEIALAFQNLQDLYDPEKHVPAISGTELMDLDFPPMEHVVKGLLPKGLSILSGAPKVGKSWLAMDLCLHVAKGEPFWGMEVTQGTVWYLSLEDTNASAQYRLACLNAEEKLDNLYFSTKDQSPGTMADGLPNTIAKFMRKHPDSAGRVGAEDGSRHRTQLAGPDRVTENGDRNRSADFGAANATGQRPGTARIFGRDPEKVGSAGDARRTAGHSQSAGQDADAAAKADNGSNGIVSPGDFDSNRGSTEEDFERDDFDRITLWAAEREVFESNLRRAAEPAKVDAPGSAHQPHSQRTAGHPIVDTAYLTANLLGIFDDDDEIEDCTTRYYGPTLSI